jgi:hypothetical protein
MLQSDKMQPELLQHLDEIVGRASSRAYARNLDVDKVAAMLRDGEKHNQPSGKPWIITGIVVLVGLGALCFSWCIYKGKRCPCGSKYSSPRDQNGITTVVHKMNKCDKELQVQAGEAGTLGVEVNEAIPEEKERLQMVPTVFVRHGQRLAECPE